MRVLGTHASWAGVAALFQWPSARHDIAWHVAIRVAILSRFSELLEFIGRGTRAALGGSAAWASQIVGLPAYGAGRRRPATRLASGLRASSPGRPVQRASSLPP